jgi:cytochrome P450
MEGNSPVSWRESTQSWFVTSHDDVRDVLRDKEFWTDPRKAERGDAAILALTGEPALVLLDDPEHRRLRGLVNKAFTPKAVEVLRPRIATLAEELVGAIDTEEFDLITTLAGPLPVIVIAELLGVNPDLRERFKARSDEIAKALNPLCAKEDRDVAATAWSELNAVFVATLEERRQRPSNDLISAMANAESSGDRFTDAEIVRLCNLLLVAGNITTTDLIGNGVRALVRHPDQYEKLRNNEQLLANAVEEMLRYDSPTVEVARIANRPLELRGCPVRQRQTIVVSLTAANHDPSAYPAPRRFDIERQDVHHQSFGGGRHFCLGAPLARAEAQEAVRALLRRFPKLIESPKGAVFRAIPGFHGMSVYWLAV